ncbi:CIC11C00000003063 [Sungouiella intermedia]|uniref:CIC11C00000003063 n=1 Tax=Sungouiella intermedia TaxID=45354 RepID=A0A1L0DU75_9ASCO|nr:CIC11C00000003063 [[Candida] intermedia]
MRRLLTIVPFALVAGSCTMLLFVLLSGATDNLKFLNKFYFSSVTTSAETRWTLYAICSPNGDGTVYCSNREPAYPYSPSDNFGDSLVPNDFVKNRNTYFYLLKIAYAWFLLALIFSLLALGPILWSCIWRGFLTGFFASFVIGTAFLFSLLGSLFITAAHVKGVKAFKKAGYQAKVGRDMMVVIWLLFVFLLASLIWMIFVGIHGAEEEFEDHESHFEKHLRHSSELD